MGLFYLTYYSLRTLVTIYVLVFGRIVKLENNAPLFNVKVDDKVKMSHLVTIASHHIGKHL